MGTMVKQWLVVLNEVMQDYDEKANENENRYYGLFYWNVRHHNARLMMQSVRLTNGKLITIATIKVDGNKDDFNEFCELASKVKGLYDIDDILTSVEVVNEYNKR